MQAQRFTRTDVTFESHEEQLAAWLYRPSPEPDRPVPIVVMAHGLGALRTMGLDAYASRFAEAGYAVMAFDYRGFGESSGGPRHIITRKGQREDWRAAISHARTLSGIDTANVVLWGTSLSGGHVIILAADPATPIAAMIAQVPFTDGVASSMSPSFRSSSKATVLAVRDLVAKLLRRPPVAIRLTGEPGDAAMMTTDGAATHQSKLADPGTSPTTEVPARAGLEILLDRPGPLLPKIDVPALVCVMEHDTITPTKPTLKWLSRASRIETRTYPGGHFDIYFEPLRNQAINDQLDFLRRVVPVG
jgi:pimeloyl-ACP methyl ester carboxylesterase